MNEEEIQVVKTASCPSLSGSSTISYEIGNLGDSQYIRLAGRSDKGGICCKDWISMVDIRQLLSGSPNYTSQTLKPLYAGKSANSPGFLLAALVHEKLTVRDSDPSEVAPSKTAPSNTVPTEQASKPNPESQPQKKPGRKAKEIQT